MSNNFSVSLTNIISSMGLNIAFMPNDPDKILISEKDINRLGLELTGFFDYFNSTRLVVMGRTENAYLSGLTSEERYKILDGIFAFEPPAVIITKNIEPYPELIEAAKKSFIPILRTSEMTSNFIADIVEFLDVKLAPRITRHGVLVEVYGQGIYIIGDSGVGKSETAIELIQRGHRLVADDSVQIRKINDKKLTGSAPKNLRHFIELRGVGIIDARSIFGMGSVKVTQEIDMVVNLEMWDRAKIYDRIGIENEYAKILGVNIPIVTIPVTPGRNLAIIVEVAAMNNRQKKMGYNAAKELLDGLGMDYFNNDIVTNNQIKLNI